MEKLMSLLVHLHVVLILFFPRSGSAILYNVLDYGARPDGTTDAAEPLLRAWADACNSPHPATVRVPAGTFLVSQATFFGPCINRAITLSVEGTVVAPPGYDGYGASGRWIMFANVEGVRVSGGTFDGRGAPLWDCKLADRDCPIGASSLTFLNSRHMTIDGVTSINSELFHIVIMQCQGVTVRGVTIVAPGKGAPNTDGIHIHMSSHVAVHQANIKTGDDCISIGPGNSHLWIERVVCGPGHGISIGSLGKEEGMPVEKVENVTVKATKFTDTENGLRIKTWATAKRGYVQGVTFMDAVMRNVQNPIIIDQNYCPGGKGCPGQSSGIKISDVKFIGIRGSSTMVVAMNFDCSASNPCSGISLQDVELTYRNKLARSFCMNAQGSASGLVFPPSCL